MMPMIEVSEPLADFHARTIPPGLAVAQVWAYRPLRAALVLGSAQRDDLLDPAATAAAGVEVVRRRSGGGAVYVDPSTSLWLDIVVPPADARWSDDVRAATYWVGEAWKAAFARIGMETVMHRGAVEPTPWGRLVCFGAIGPGELAIDGCKVLGVAQRRTREGARFQCLVYESWEPERVLDLLDLSPGERSNAGSDLASVAMGVGSRLPALRAAILDELTAASSMS